MATATTHSAYRETGVLSSSPEQLVPLLYEHLLVNLKRSAMRIRAGDIEGKFESLTRAADIVVELLSALDHEAGGELAQRLAALYAFWLREINVAGRDLDAGRVEEVAAMVASLLEAWEQAARIGEMDEEPPDGIGRAG